MIPTHVLLGDDVTVYHPDLVNLSASEMVFEPRTSVSVDIRKEASTGRISMVMSVGLGAAVQTALGQRRIDTVTGAGCHDPG